jgi:hypothetical protein
MTPPTPPTPPTDPPPLDIEQHRASGEPGPLGEHHALECRIVWHLLQHLQAAGFQVLAVFDGESTRRCAGHKEAMEMLFALGGGWLRVRRQGERQGERQGYNIAVVPGRGVGVIGEYWVAPGDPDGFATCMAAFGVQRPRVPFGSQQESRRASSA